MLSTLRLTPNAFAKLFTAGSLKEKGDIQLFGNIGNLKNTFEINVGYFYFFEDLVKNAQVKLAQDEPKTTFF
jgi:hypothetical protein